MTVRSVGALAAMAVVLTGTGAAQLWPAAGHSISVNGEAEVRVVPDEVILTLGVETFDARLSASKQLNDERIRQAITAARTRGVPANAIQTDYISIEPRYNRDDISRELLGYVVRKSLVVKLSDLSRFEDLLSAALEAGVTHVHGIEFRTTELRKHRDQARVLAVRAAKEKAELLAGESGRQAGQTLSIGEASYGYASSYGSHWGSRYGSIGQNVMQSVGGAAVSDDRTLAPGQIAIRVSVSISCALE